MQSLDTSSTALRFGFLLAPRFSMMSLSAAIEPIRVANRLLGRSAFAWRTCSSDGKPVTASNDLVIDAESAAAVTEKVDVLFLCAGTRLDAKSEAPLIRAIRSAGRQKRGIGGLSTATHLLARAGVMGGYRCTIHWENLPALREEFPDLLVTEALYEIDRDRFTSSGGTAAMDMMLQIIRLRHGDDIALEVAAQFQHGKIRAHDERQTGWQQRNVAMLPPILRQATTIMQSRIEDPIAINDLAERVGISQRQLERLFAAQFSMHPKQYYLMLQAERGRELLSYTEKSLVEIAVATGFGSVAQLSKWFRHFHGQLPSAYRSAARR